VENYIKNHAESIAVIHPYTYRFPISIPPSNKFCLTIFRSHSMTPLGKSSQDPILTNKKLGMVTCTCHPSHLRTAVQADLDIKVRPHSKNKLKRTAGVAQVVVVVVCLPRKHEAQSWNPSQHCSPPKKKKITI
jgi:hypothetical protein